MRSSLEIRSKLDTMFSGNYHFAYILGAFADVYRGRTGKSWKCNVFCLFGLISWQYKTVSEHSNN